MDNIYLKKYIKYKKKYYNLKIQYAGELDDLAKQKIINQIFPTDRKNPEYEQLLIELFKKINLNLNKCKSDTYVNTQIEFHICEIDKLFEIIPNNVEESQLNQQKINDTFPNLLASGAYGKVMMGKLLKDQSDNSYLIKIPIINSLFNDYQKYNTQLSLIKEAYINLCIINDIIIKYTTNNLIFTFGLLFSPICKDFTCFNEFNINLIQPRLNPSERFEDVIKQDINLLTFVTYLKQIFSQLVILEESEFELIHGDLHCQNILISNKKVYIIDWGFGSFKFNNKRIRAENNFEKLYFQNDHNYNKKTGLSDLYQLLHDCKSLKNILIDDFINRLLDKIFFSGNIKIFNNNTNQPDVLTKIHYDWGIWLYIVIGGYNKMIDENYYPQNFTNEIYDFNEPYFTKYTYKEILKEITKLYDEIDPPKINKKCKKN